MVARESIRLRVGSLVINFNTDVGTSILGFHTNLYLLPKFFCRFITVLFFITESILKNFKDTLVLGLEKDI